MIKRYLCFSYYYYESGGGMNDFIAECDTLNEAMEVFNNKEPSGGTNEFQIYDLENKILYTRSDDSETWDSEIILRDK